MSTLLDTINTNGCSLLSFDKIETKQQRDLVAHLNSVTFKDLLRSAQVIDINNVATFYHNQHKSYTTKEDFPNLAPPYSTHFMEFYPRQAFSDPDEAFRVGVLYASVGWKFPDDLRYYVSQFPHQIISPDQIHWFTCAYVFGQLQKDAPVVALGSYEYILDKTGAVLPTVGYKSPTSVRQFWNPPNPQEYEDFRKVRNCCSLAISLLHCKNVATQDHEPSDKLNKSRIRKGKQPLVTFKTLDIAPMKLILSSEGSLETNGLNKALHCCRGHFKNYQERGLFGRIKGLFWWNEHTRGKPETGVVFKDYNILQPTLS